MIQEIKAGWSRSVSWVCILCNEGGGVSGCLVCVCGNVHVYVSLHIKMMDFIPRYLWDWHCWDLSNIRSSIQRSQRGQQVISKLKGSGSRGVRWCHNSATSAYNTPHNWLGCSPDYIFISLMSHSPGIFQHVGRMIYMYLVLLTFLVMKFSSVQLADELLAPGAYGIKGQGWT